MTDTIRKQQFIITITNAEPIKAAVLENVVGDYMDNGYEGSWKSMSVRKYARPE
jgi:hypothetical protein